jgi:hypothetical protein
MKTAFEFHPSPNTSSRLLALALLLFLGLSAAPRAGAQSYVLSNLWSVAAGSPTHPFLQDDDRTRGLAYNPVTGHVLVVSRTSSNAVYVLDGATGAILGTLPYDTNVISGGTFHVNLVGVTDDGVIYVGNLTTDAIGTAGPYKLYRWANETAAPQLVYSGDPSFSDATANNRRFGDSMSVRGTGTGTQILLGTLGPNAALLTTADGTNFTATKITTDAASGDLRWGLAWGAGNTFWVKQASGNLKQLTLNLPGNTASVTLSISGIVGGPLGVDVTRNLLAIVEAGTTTTTGHKLRLYDISNPSAPIQVDTTRSFPASNANGNATGAVSIRNGKLFALETNNGILAYNLAAVYLPPVITTPPGKRDGVGRRRVLDLHRGLERHAALHLSVALQRRGHPRRHRVHLHDFQREPRAPGRLQRCGEQFRRQRHQQRRPAHGATGQPLAHRHQHLERRRRLAALPHHRLSRIRRGHQPADHQRHRRHPPEPHQHDRRAGHPDRRAQALH